MLAIDDLSSGREENLAADAGFEVVDICDAEALEEVFGEFGPDQVFHLAAQVSVQSSLEDPGLDARINVEGTVNVLEATVRAGCRKLAFASSCAIYGEPQRTQLPLSELSAPLPTSGYGQAKLSAEGYLALYRQLHGIAAVSLRFGNVYGPRQSSKGEAGVVAIFCRQIQEGSRPTVYGDGLQTRDYIYVGDVAEAMVEAAERDVSGALNLGSGTETNVLELIEKIGAAADRRPDELEPELLPARPEVRRMVLDRTLAGKVLGWSPNVGLDDGLRWTWDSYLDGRDDTAGPAPVEALD